MECCTHDCQRPCTVVPLLLSHIHALSTWSGMPRSQFFNFFGFGPDPSESTNLYEIRSTLGTLHPHLLVKLECFYSKLSWMIYYDHVAIMQLSAQRRFTTLAQQRRMFIFISHTTPYILTFNSSLLSLEKTLDCSTSSGGEWRWKEQNAGNAGNNSARNFIV